MDTLQTAPEEGMDRREAMEKGWNWAKVVFASAAITTTAVVKLLEKNTKPHDAKTETRPKP